VKNRRESYLNSSTNILQRAVFTERILSVLEHKKVILNFDESIIQEENFHNKICHMKGPHYAR
jgi:hypothetical protein